MSDSGLGDPLTGTGDPERKSTPTGTGLVAADPYAFVADVRVEEVAFARTALDHASTVTVRLRYETAVNDNPAVFLAADGRDFAAFEDALTRDETLRSVSAITAKSTRRVYCVRPVDDCPLFPSNVLRMQGRVLSYRLDRRAWELRVTFPKRAWLVEFTAYCRDHGMQPSVVDITTSDGEEMALPGLAPNDRRLLLTAYDRGYFESPRGISQEDLAAAVDASPSTVSYRLSRATRDLLRSELL